MPGAAHPSAHLARYHSVLAPCASWRERVVPGGLPSRRSSQMARCRDHQGPATGRESGEPRRLAAPGEIIETPDSRSRDGAAAVPAAARREGDAGLAGVQGSATGRRYAWADLMRRVFAVEVLECSQCGGHLRILAAIHPPDTTQAILECLGLPARAPPLASARIEPTPAGW